MSKTYLLFDQSEHFFISWSFPPSILTLGVRLLPKKEYSAYDTKLHLALWLQFWSSRNYEEPLHCNYSHVHSYVEWLYLLGSDLWVVFVAASHQTRLDTRSKARRPIKVGIKGRGRSGTSRDSNPACLCCSCEPDEASSFTNPNVGPGTYPS